MPTVTTLSGAIISVDLGTRDFESYRNSILEIDGLADAYTVNWTDRSELDLGVAMTEVFSFFGDNLSYYQDRCANEALFTPAIQRRSVVQQCKALNYELQPNVSASVDLTFVCNAAGTAPAVNRVSVDTSDGSEEVIFELLNDFVSTGSGTYTGIEAVHGTTVTDPPYSSTGGAGQKFTLAQTPLTLTIGGGSSLNLWVNEGIPVLWTEVDNFLESGPTDTVYKVEIKENDEVTIIFGNNLKGKIPIAGVGNVLPIYRIGGGIVGNEVGRNKLTILSGSHAFVDSVTNPLEPSGGNNREPIATAKVEAPLNLKAMNRAVTHADYATLAKRVGGVAQAIAYRGNGAFEERVVIAAGGSNPIPTGSWDPYTEIGTGLIGTVGSYLNERKTTPVILYIDPCRVVQMNLHIRVYLFDSVRQSDARRVIDNTIYSGLDVQTVALGTQLPLSYIMDILEDTPGVDYVDVLRFQREPSPKQLYGITDITFGDWVYGETTPRDYWTVQFTSATNFTVLGVNAGLQTNIGTLGTPYLVDDGTFGFTATSGASPNVVDRWGLITGPYIGNMDPTFDELCRLLGLVYTLELSGGVG